MYKIEKRPSGYILTFSGVINPEEMQRWVHESEKTLLTESRTSFGVIINMKDLEPLSMESNKLLISGQKLYKERGMQRSSVILNNSALCTKLKNTAIQSGIYTTERYIDASLIENPVEVAVNWVKDAIDPDL